MSDSNLGVQVLVTSRSFSTGDADALEQLEAAGAHVVAGPADHDLAVLRPLLRDTVAWIAGTGPVAAEHLDAAPLLRLVARYGVGVDAVDLVEAERRGVLVTNTPGANSGAVADHALALILAALRSIPAGDRAVRSGDWSVQPTRELGGLTVGLIGVGRIGQGVATRLAGFGSTVLGHDPWVGDEAMRSFGMEPVSLGELAARSDVVSLHAPGDQVLVDEDWLASAKFGLILVNTARAHLVDESALALALSAGTVSMYASDTLSTESGQDGPTHPLLHHDLRDCTIFTPHSAANTVEAVDGMSLGAVRSVLALLRGETCCAGRPRPTSSGRRPP